MWATSWYRSKASSLTQPALTRPLIPQCANCLLRQSSYACHCCPSPARIARADRTEHTDRTDRADRTERTERIAHHDRTDRTDCTSGIRLTTHIYQTPICPGLLPGAPPSRHEWIMLSHLTRLHTSVAPSISVRYNSHIMRCSRCSTKMPDSGFCPTCGHLSLVDDTDSAEQPETASADGASILSDAASAPTTASSGAPPQLLQSSRDYSALLLGIVVFSLLLHPSLAWLLLVVRYYPRVWAFILPAVWALVSYIITRLLCDIQPRTRGWIIRHAGLRRFFRWLNSLWFAT